MLVFCLFLVFPAQHFVPEVVPGAERDAILFIKAGIPVGSSVVVGALELRKVRYVAAGEKTLPVSSTDFPREIGVEFGELCSFEFPRLFLLCGYFPYFDLYSRPRGLFGAYRCLPEGAMNFNCDWLGRHNSVCRLR